MHWMDGEPHFRLPTMCFSWVFERFRKLSQKSTRDWRRTGARFLECRSTELRPRRKDLITALVGEKPGANGWEWVGGEFWGAVLDLGEEGTVVDR